MRLDASLGFATPLAEVAAVARRADEAGVAGVWTAETSHDPFLPLALAAESTERLELGTAIAVAFARSPLVVASTAWDLAQLSNGRLMLDAFAVVASPADVRTSLERRAEGLIDRAAPYQPFGSRAWQALAR
jgi:luciferase-like monooxygenase